MKKSTKSALETQRFATALAKNIVLLPEIPRSKTKFRSGAMVLALVGELGSGKTTFVQGFAKGLGVKGKIPSPTFILIRRYKLKTKHYKLLYHIDCYRLDNPVKELPGLGFKKIIANPRAIVMVEWADRVKSLLPPHTIWISFTHTGKVLTERNVAMID